jgi:hypothetical protein
MRSMVEGFWTVEAEGPLRHSFGMPPPLEIEERRFLRCVALVAGVPKPGAGLALRFGDFSRGHLEGDFGAAGLAAGVSRQRGEVEPFVRLDKVDGDAAAAGRVGHAKLVKRFDAAGFRFGHPAAKEEVGTFLTNRHKTSPLFVRSSRGSRSSSKQMVNDAVTLYLNCVRNDTDIVD